MERKQFLSLLGVGTVSAFILPALDSCSKKSESSSTTNTNLTLNLTDTANTALASPGGYIYKNNIIIAHLISGSYVALSSICTHQSCTVSFDESASDFPCHCHNSLFASNGSVINGPATLPLTSYKTTLSGNTLTIAL